MSQNSVDFSGDPSGIELLDDLLSPLQQNILTGNSGTGRPSYAQEGTEWLDKTTTPWVVNRFDGTDDIIVGYINASTNIYTPAGLVLDKTDATTAPGINDDAGDGYVVGSKWIDVTNDKAYILVDATTGAAIWKEISGNVTGQTSSVDSEIVLFSSTTGKSLKRATGSGYVQVVNGVMQTPAATIPLSDLSNQAANSVVLNNTGSSAAPGALAMASSTILARLASGNIVAASVAQIITLLGITIPHVPDFQQFTSSGTWTKPSGFGANAWALIETIGAGAGGANFSSAGSDGGNSSFGSWCIGYGGNAGTGWTGSASGTGHDGGGVASKTNRGAEGKYGNSANGFAGYDGYYTGGGGGTSTGGKGGDSVYGGGGGGYSTAGTSQFSGNGGAVGVSGSAPGGGGGAGSAGGGSPNGGGGGSYKYRRVLLSSLGATESVTIGAGGTGASSAGNGARGEVRITVFE